MRELSIKTGRCFVLVFALNNPSSFNETVDLYRQITKIRGDCNLPIVLVGNKSDLPRTIDKETISKRKQIELNNIPYIETSAKLDLNIKAVFQELLMLAMEQENLIENNRKLQDKQQHQTPMKKARNQLFRRLSTFGSLPNINLIRRKSTNSPNNHSSNSSICSESSSNGIEECSPKHQLKNKSNSIQAKPMFYSPIIKRKFNDVKPQLSLDETKIKDLNQRIIKNKRSNTKSSKSFDTASTTSSLSSSNGSNSTNNSMQGSLKGSKDSLEYKTCSMM